MRTGNVDDRARMHTNLRVTGKRAYGTRHGGSTETDLTAGRYNRGIRLNEHFLAAQLHARQRLRLVVYGGGGVREFGQHGRVAAAPNIESAAFLRGDGDPAARPAGAADAHCLSCQQTNRSVGIDRRRC